MKRAKAENLMLMMLSVKYQKKVHGALVLVLVNMVKKINTILLIYINMANVFQYYAITCILKKIRFMNVLGE